MRLIASLTSPYVRKVRAVLAEKKLDYKLELDDPWSQSPLVAQHNPVGKVPCLVLEGGDALYDSRVIVEYVDTLSPLGRLIPERGRERAEVRTWEALADGLLDAAVAARLESAWAGRSDEQRSQAWIDRQLGKIDASLDAMSKGLGEQPWFSGQHLSLADIAVGVAVLYLDFRFPQIDWRNRHPNLARLADKLNQRPSFQLTQPPV
ncbi:MAG: glutathione S-transferase C-terminal domain-containing protein [Leptothrix sp. (in: b-proteobacteria)]